MIGILSICYLFDFLFRRAINFYAFLCEAQKNIFEKFE
jgi:hypothetical protein